ncbi:MULTISPECIES: three-helix bundle dimerization domain-containing protein [unclassified Rhodococcus (in: high G+C Gram-positive bacteria)]|uniref:three-helix bundle dimerization domain-containing protein n=1 Tax=unclassified Rhodococcus (in: high G+C Gram-positive bacteria) TaxID=192944 RepID=UPI001639ECCD|nr:MULTISPECIES: hypothetical protein [unclassified Rhodococcus (in: high G+C Gram-positive bacteria)]MBC2642643.1 hypothetical protein [Rhodococcus sp. 3A]MBC2892615.1 hypothetical protein [Rhodococcus sp. 4CII]
MDITEQHHLDAVRTQLIRRYQYLDPDPDQIETVIDTAHHRFDGCQIRDFVPLLVERAATRALDESLTITPTTAYPAAPETR